MSDIVNQIVHQITIFLERRKLVLAFPPERIAKQICQYIDIRRKGSPLSISQLNCKPPENWTDHHETVWQDWFANEVSLKDWLHEVFNPVFGTEQCSWDYICDGWRSELLTFLPTWASRSFTIVAAYDATPYDSDVEDDMDPYSATIDPYLMDHGSKKTKNRS